MQQDVDGAWVEMELGGQVGGGAGGGAEGFEEVGF